MGIMNPGWVSNALELDLAGFIVNSSNMAVAYICFILMDGVSTVFVFDG